MGGLGLGFLFVFFVICYFCLVSLHPSFGVVLFVVVFWVFCGFLWVLFVVVFWVFCSFFRVFLGGLKTHTAYSTTVNVIRTHIAHTRHGCMRRKVMVIPRKSK